MTIGARAWRASQSCRIRRVSSNHCPRQQCSSQGVMMNARVVKSTRVNGGRTENGTDHSQLRVGAPTMMSVPGGDASASALTSSTAW
jgi:hypothetical protein